MRRPVSIISYLLLLLFVNAAAKAQDASALPSIDTGQPVSDSKQIVAYETAVLPKDREAAWLMLRAATGLHGDELAPWYLSAHYKTYDAYGRSKGEGKLEYLWAGHNRWHVTYTEGATVWTRWDTDKGLFAPPGQPATPGYPESLITSTIRHPLEDDGVPNEAPLFLADQKIASLTLSCFSNTASVQTVESAPLAKDSRPQHFCADQGAPRLRLSQASYNVYFNRLSAFQHQIVATEIKVRDGNEGVVDISIDQLRTMKSSELPLLIPPANAAELRDNTLLLPLEHASLHRLKHPNPSYPAAMKEARVQGTVRLAITIGKDGKPTIDEVLHSPDPSLTASSEEAVQHWLYEPYLKDGEPVKVRTTVIMTYTLGR